MAMLVTTRLGKFLHQICLIDWITDLLLVKSSLCLRCSNPTFFCWFNHQWFVTATIQNYFGMISFLHWWNFIYFVGQIPGFPWFQIPRFTESTLLHTLSTKAWRLAVNRFVETSKRSIRRRLGVDWLVILWGYNDGIWVYDVVCIIYIYMIHIYIIIYIYI